jgi:hypothetical protein
MTPSEGITKMIARLTDCWNWSHRWGLLEEKAQEAGVGLQHLS